MSGSVVFFWQRELKGNFLHKLCTSSDESSGSGDGWAEGVSEEVVGVVALVSASVVFFWQRELKGNFLHKLCTSSDESSGSGDG